MDDRHISPRIISREAVVIDVPLWYKYPPQVRNANIDVDIEARAHRCPSVISTAAPPAYPCWSPYGIGDPDPLPVAVVHPSSVMERCPAPIIIGYPGISVFCHRPASVGVVRPEITLLHVGAPYVPVLRILNPGAVR